MIRAMIFVLFGVALGFGGARLTSSAGAPESNESPGLLRPALEQALRQPSQLDRIRQLSAHIERLDADNLDEALQVYEREHWWLRETEIMLFLEAWARFDPESAHDYAVRWPSSENRLNAITAALRAFALHDPQEAAAKAEERAQAYPRNRSRLIEAAFVGWVESREPGLIDLMATKPEESWPYNAMIVAGATTRLADVANTIAWAEGVVTRDVPDGLKKQIFRRVTGMVARLDPEAAAAWIAKHANQDYADRGPRLLLERWIPQDPVAATRWADASVPPEEQWAMLQNAYTKWLTRSFEEASAWIEAVSPEPRPDAALTAYANVVAQRDPEAALAWSEQVQDEKRRLISLERTASAWYRRNPMVAETWLNLSALDEDARKRVRSASERRPKRALEGL